MGGALFLLSLRVSQCEDCDMVVARLDHVQLPIPEGGEDRARWFYRDILGLPEIPKPPHLAKRGGCWFERGALKVHLGVDPDFRPAQKAHPGTPTEVVAQATVALTLPGPLGPCGGRKPHSDRAVIRRAL
jgi:catechol 2,3-dioxygenase-like lactoylglutathione lyase family enzyme